MSPRVPDPEEQPPPPVESEEDMPPAQNETESKPGRRLHSSWADVKAVREGIGPTDSTRVNLAREGRVIE